MEERATATITFKDRYGTTHEHRVEQAEFESDEAFMVRVASMLGTLRESSQ